MPLLRKPERNERNNTLDIINRYRRADEKQTLAFDLLIHSYNNNRLIIKNVSARSFLEICPDFREKIRATEGNITQEDKRNIQYIPESLERYIQMRQTGRYIPMNTKESNNNKPVNKEEEYCANILEEIEAEISTRAQIQMQREESEDQSKIEKKLKSD